MFDDKISRLNVFRIENPKNVADSQAAKASKIFPYYAGYSSSFANALVESAELPAGALILDPWAGSGTTLLAAARNGHRAIGIDLNPVMVVASRANLLVFADTLTLVDQAKFFVGEVDKYICSKGEDDPLCNWFSPSSAQYIRALELAINREAFFADDYASLLQESNLSKLNATTAFFYICLFRVARKLLSDFIPSNPTWVKLPKDLNKRKRPSREKIHSGFLLEVEALSKYFANSNLTAEKIENIKTILGNSEHTGLPEKSIDFVLTSPPYCTRIDYAVATSIELAVMRVSDAEFLDLRRSLLGSSMILPETPQVDSRWGATCNKFLQEVYAHSSQASRGYYFKTHLQYFNSLFCSILETFRILKHGSYCVFVVQDSFYKDIKNNIAEIVMEMFFLMGVVLVQREDFSKKNSLSVINPKARKYLNSRDSTEAVLVFQKTN